MYSTKEKLLPEHAGKHGSEIKALREAGTRVTATVEVPEVAFTGDTAADWIDRAADGSDAVAADALRAKLLICECTFVDDRCTPEDARAYGHTHVDELIERAAAFENESILLIHFSARYKADEIDARARGETPAGLARARHALTRRVRVANRGASAATGKRPTLARARERHVGSRRRGERANVRTFILHALISITIRYPYYARYTFTSSSPGDATRGPSLT